MALLTWCGIRSMICSSKRWEKGQVLLYRRLMAYLG